MEFPDRTLLDRYLATRDEAAFAALVRRYLDQVHGVARRVTGNDELARDVAQAAFIRLAQRAALIPHDLPLSSWLHRVARSLAVDLVRVESRRKKRELAHDPTPDPLAMMDPATPPEPDWSKLAPVVDELVEQLSAADRDVLLLRYYRNESHAAIAARLGLSEGTARKRALRALEKLRVLLGKRGIATSSAALSTLLPAHAAPVAPGLLAVSVLQAAHGIAPLAPSFLNSLFLAMTSSQKIALGGALLLMLAATGYTLAPDPTTTAVAALTNPPSPLPGKLDATRSLTPRPVPATAEERLERLKAILAGKNLNRRRAELIAYLDALPAGLWGETCGVLLDLQVKPGDEALTYVLCGWAKANPLAALAFTRERTQAIRDSSRWDLPREVITGWATVDFRAAMDWITTQATEEERPLLFDTALPAGLLVSPEEVIEVVNGLNEPLESQHAMDLLAAAATRQADLQSRLMAAGTPELQAKIIGKVAEKFEPVGAMELLRDHPEAAEFIDFHGLYARLGMFRYDLAKAGLAEMKPGPQRREAAAGLLDTIAGMTPTGAQEIMQLYPDAATDEHRRKIIPMLATTDPARALAVIPTLSDAGERDFTTAAQLKAWQQRDPAAAAQWLADHPQPAAVLERLNAH